MSTFVKKNRFLIVVLVGTILFTGLTFANLPGPEIPTGERTINGVTFDFADYMAVDHELLALLNYLDTIISSDYQDYGEWEGWFVSDAPQLIHYNIAFITYASSYIFESISGYRTDYFKDLAYDAIKRMNTTEADYGEDSVEFIEWSSPDLYGDPGYVDYYYPNATHPDGDDIYTGGFRGPANIMWTAHYALMLALFERNFNTGLMADELSWFIENWNMSMTTDGFGNPKEGGIWGVGLVPCEPYIVFTQCNSIPIAATELYDSLYGTNYMPIWDYGLETMNEVMQDEYGLTTHGLYVQEPTGFYYENEGLPETYPSLAMSPDNPTKPRFEGYGSAWTMAWLEHTQPEVTAEEYPILLDTCMKDVSGDMAYMISTYNNPDQYYYFEIFATLFTMHLANQQGDYATRDRLANWFFDFYNKEWSNNGRAMHYNTLALAGFAQPILALGQIWAEAPVTIEDVLDARPAAFWDYPYVSEADDDNIWIYQAEWDPVKEGFILNIKVDRASTLTFSNFDSMPTAYLVGGGTMSLESAGAGLFSLDLNPGNYQIVIM